MPVYNIEEIIQYEDRHIVVCRKPAGLAVQSARIGQQDLESMLKNHIAQSAPGRIPFLGVVHRLDQPAEGLLVFGRDKKSTGELNRQLQSGALGKSYLAVVHGRPEPPEGSFTDYLTKDGRTRASAVVMEGQPGAKRAKLRYRVLEEWKDLALLKIVIETGRYHQIRAQMAYHGHPLAGDVRYGREDGWGSAALCADELSLRHPASGEKMEFHIKPDGAVFQNFSFCRE